MIKIAVLYPYSTGDKAFSGGVPKVAVSNIIAIKNIGCDPYLVLPKDNSGLITYIKKYHPYCKIIPVDFKPLSFFSDTKGFARYTNIVKNFIGLLAGRKELKNELDSICPDIIHFHEVINFPILNIAPKAKAILHLHSFRFTKYRWILKFIMRFINNQADLVISPTKSILDSLGPKLTVNSMILNTPYLDLQTTTIAAKSEIINKIREFKQDGKTVFAFVGRICSIKRIDHFLDAISYLDSQQRKKIVFCIVGGTNDIGDRIYKDSLEKQILKLNIGNLVEFCGYINPIEQFLDLVDYGVILSESEAVPMIGIEFMRFNIPILGYNAPGISDFLKDNVNGFLIENGSIEELRRIVSWLLTDQSKDANFTESITQEFNKYSIESFSENLYQIYNDILHL